MYTFCYILFNSAHRCGLVFYEGCAHSPERACSGKVFATRCNGRFTSPPPRPLCTIHSMGNVLDKQIETTNGTPRLRGGRLFGLWVYNNGSKYWDELDVVSLTAVPTATATPVVTETAVSARSSLRTVAGVLSGHFLVAS